MRAIPLLLLQQLFSILLAQQVLLWILIWILSFLQFFRLFLLFLRFLLFDRWLPGWRLMASGGR